MGAGSTIQDLEDFLVSNNLLPLGSLIYLLFCTSRYGWGWDNFIAEADAGKGHQVPEVGTVLCELYFAADCAVYFCDGVLAEICGVKKAYG